MKEGRCPPSRHTIRTLRDAGEHTSVGMSRDGRCLTGRHVASLYVWDPIAGYAHETGVYGLVAFCQNYGGYYYLADDGAWYWFSC